MAQRIKLNLVAQPPLWFGLCQTFPLNNPPIISNYADNPFALSFALSFSFSFFYFFYLFRNTTVFFVFVFSSISRIKKLFLLLFQY